MEHQWKVQYFPLIIKFDNSTSFTTLEFYEDGSSWGSLIFDIPWYPIRHAMGAQLFKMEKTAYLIEPQSFIYRHMLQLDMLITA